MYGYSSPPIHHMNNPFANNDAVSANARYPAISTSPGIDPNQQQQQFYGNGSGYPQQQQAQYGYPQQQQQPQMQMGGYGGLSPQPQQPQYAATPSPSGFQPSSSFGQQMAAAISGSSYGYLSGQPTGLPQQQHQQLGPAQQQISNNPGYVAQFDPYGPLSQWDGTSGQQQRQQPQQQQYQQQPQQQQQYGMAGGGPQMYSAGVGGMASPLSPGASSMGVSPSGDPHPQDFLRSHKAEIEGWNAAGWKRFLTTFDALGNAWNARKTACGQQVEALKNQLPFAGYYQQQVQAEMARVQGLAKEAENHFDSVTASKFQMQEVFSGYRQSADPASKRRVREATNAAMQSLPGWPPSQI